MCPRQEGAPKIAVTSHVRSQSYVDRRQAVPELPSYGPREAHGIDDADTNTAKEMDKLIEGARLTLKDLRAATKTPAILRYIEQKSEYRDTLIERKRKLLPA